MQLHRFEGREVIGTKVAITRAGDGLSQALAIEPTELGLGDEVFVVLQCIVSRIGYERVKDTEALTRVQTLQAGTATIVDKAMVSEKLEEQRVKIEEARGIARLDFDPDEPGDDDDHEGVSPDGD